MGALAKKLEPLHDAEAVLFIDNDQAEALVFNVFGNKRVGPNREVSDALADQPLEFSSFRVGRGNPSNQQTTYPTGSKSLRKLIRC